MTDCFSAATQLIELEASAILFDNDGVLVDSHALVDQAWSEVASVYRLDFNQLLSELAGVRAADTLGKYLEQPDLNEAVALLEKLEVGLADQTPSLMGASALLASLPPGAWTIVTSASKVLAEARWTGAGIAWPENIVTADDVTRGKPDPEPFLMGASKLNVPVEACVVFEDSDAGGRAGRAAGARVVAVGDIPWSFEPDARIKDLSCVEVQSADPLTVQSGLWRAADLQIRLHVTA